MTGFEEAFKGRRSIPTLPDDLLTASAQTGRLNLLLRVRQGDADAIRDALVVIEDAKADSPNALPRCGSSAV